MTLPNYQDGSIVNLMSSVKNACGGTSLYQELKLLPAKDLKSKNIVLIVIDGLGFNFLKIQNSILNQGLKGCITSVFPSTTASAVTTFATGVAPQQHGFTGWYMLLKELGVVSTALQYSPRIGGGPFSESGVSLHKILKVPGFTEDLSIDSYVIKWKNIINSDFTEATRGNAKKIGVRTLKSFFREIKKTLKKNNRKKYVYGYWHEFDKIAHEHGINSKEIDLHFKDICIEVIKLLKHNSDTTLIITADHGLIDTTKKRSIRLRDHPELIECLTLPLCGDSRVKYCYVHPSKAVKFEKYITKKFSRFCSMYKSQELIDKNYFGLYEPNPELFNRIGDYVLIMKENYVFRDTMPNKNPKFDIGNHSGTSSDEMLVPLIVF